MFFCFVDRGTPGKNLLAAPDHPKIDASIGTYTNWRLLSKCYGPIINLYDEKGIKLPDCLMIDFNIGAPLFVCNLRISLVRRLRKMFTGSFVLYDRICSNDVRHFLQLHNQMFLFAWTIELW